MRILILSNDHLYSKIVLGNFLKQYHQNIVGLILPDFIIPGKSFFRSVLFLFEKSFPQFIIYKWFEQRLYQLKQLLCLSLFKSYSFYSKKYGFPIFKTRDINNQKTVRLIKKLKPDIIYSIAYPQKIKSNVLKIPPQGSINFHDSILPQYRGLCAYFWITANNEQQSGVTAIYMIPQLDQGRIVLQRKYKIQPSYTMQKVYFKNSKLMGKMILEIQSQLDNNQLKSYPQTKENESYYSWPDKKGYQLFKKNRKIFFKFKQLWDSI